ncbi:discoidin domain-containing protein [Anaerosporobacter sp.]
MKFKKFLTGILSLSMLCSVIPMNTAIGATSPWLLSKGRPAYASSINGGDVASFATDGKIGTQWGAQPDKADQWIDVDLGAEADVSKVDISWQNNVSFGVNYEILVSSDEINWSSIYHQKNGTGGAVVNVYKTDGSIDYSYYKDTIDGLSGKGRYIRLLVHYSKAQENDVDRKGWGPSVREFDIFGVGGVNKPQSNAVDLAASKTVTSSSVEKPWWASTPLEGSKGVDGDYESYWLSSPTDDEWFQVDLGKVYSIGRVVIQWQTEFGRVFDIQTSEDGEKWVTVYRNLKGNGEDEDVSMYQEARYVRMQGIAMGRGSGYSIREMKVYEYQEGDSKQNQVVPELPKEQTISVGSGSYAIDDVDFRQPREPKYITANIKTPIPSNDWWTSIVYTRLSDTMPSLPFVLKYSEGGLGLYNADGVYTRENNGGMGADSKYFELTINSSAIKNTASAKLDGYGDWSVDMVFSDDDIPKMKTTAVKGSPFIYNTFTDPDKVEITVNDLVKFFNDKKEEILLKDGESIVTDHIGVEAHNISEAPGEGDKNQYHYYGIFCPKNTTFTRVGSKIKIKLGNQENYMSVATLPTINDLNYYYSFAYAFVTDTVVDYEYNDSTAKMKTTYNCVIDNKRSGFSGKTLMCMMPHQWKYTSDALTGYSYESIRGTLKVHEGNQFSYTLPFHGITPSFSEPVESDSYDRELMVAYLKEFTESTVKDYWVADPYWQGKKTHPITMGILTAQQLGEYEIRDQLISVLKKILENWLTYSGEEEYPYYMYYSTSWGALNGDGGDHGMANNLSDHHFLWAYFIYPAAVLASYDSTFITEYGDMLEMLIRDCMNPDKNDELFPFMRNFDPYEGHSWAGGYGDNNSGNNQESASEATFAWAGLYLWGLVTENDTYRDAGIWGFTSEVNAIEQYWFNYDNDNWDSDYASGCVGMVWGLGYTNGTYFSGNPSCIYGIHMLPVTPSLTYMGYNTKAAASIYEAYKKDQAKYQDKVASEGNSDPEGWFHILWPYLSLSDPAKAAQLWEDNAEAYGLPRDEMFNSYWFIQNMNAKGTVATDIWSSNYTSCQVFQKNGVYTATVWNPTNEEIKVEFCNKTGKIGSTIVAPLATVSVNPFKDTDNSKQSIPKASIADKVIQLPGRIAAQDYYTNFSCMLDQNDQVGKYIGWIDDGDSLVYKVNVEKAGTYQISYLVQSTSDSKTGVIALKSNKSKGYLATTTLNQNKQWNTITDSVYLEEGEQTLTVLFKVGGFNFGRLIVGEDSGEEPTDPSPEDKYPMKLAEEDLSKYELLSKEKSMTASTEITGNSAQKAVDGDYNTRWESIQGVDQQWLTVDLGNTKNIKGVKIHWETAAAKEYLLQVSNDGVNWTDVYARTNGNSGVEALVAKEDIIARYVRIYGTARTTGYGYSIWEFEVYGTSAGVPKVISNGKKVSASSVLGWNYATNVTDNNYDTRWESIQGVDPQWIIIDLENTFTLSGLNLYWETAAAKNYEILLSNDGNNWESVYTTTNGNGGLNNGYANRQSGLESIKFDKSYQARYVKMYGTQRTTGYGYSLWEVEVLGY